MKRSGEERKRQDAKAEDKGNRRGQEKKETRVDESAELKCLYSEGQTIRQPQKNCTEEQLSRTLTVIPRTSCVPNSLASHFIKTCSNIF